MGRKLTYLAIIDLLKEDKDFLENEFGVVSIGLFGSYTTKKQNTSSDIDILVELKNLVLIGLLVCSFIWNKNLTKELT